MNSALNPEAPEFYPHLTSVTQEGYSAVHKSIRTSSQLPSGASYVSFKTFTDFNKLTCQLSENVIIQSNQILTTEFPAVKLKCNDNEYNAEKIIYANDNVLDRVNINIDTLNGVHRQSEKFERDIQQKINVSSWNERSAPVIAKLQVDSTTFTGAKNIPRVQLAFKDTIDNSDSLWVPKISDKPNNIKPLALNILYNDEGEAVGYEHPYSVELDLYHPPGSLIDPDPEPPSFPLPLEDTKLTYVDTEEQLDELVRHLGDVSEFAVDVEHHSYRSYQGITCLIQISTNEGGDFIIDTLAIREHIHKLNLAFTDPKKIKVFHGAECDVIWLQRDFGVYIVGLFDTHQAARTLKLTRLSLKHLLMQYCRLDADKRFQLADWRIRPLPQDLITYARSDTHYLLYIWRMMKSELLEKDAGNPSLLLSVFEMSRHICRNTYNKDSIHDNSHLSLYMRSKKSFNSQQKAALKLLYKWRDAQARALDESTIYLLPNHMLLSLAETLPREVQGVHACCSPMPPFVKQNLITIHRMILSCRELPTEPQLYNMPSGIRNMLTTTQTAITNDIHDLSQLPDFVEDQPINLDLASVFVEETNHFQPDISIFLPAYITKNGVVSDLNAEAKLFIPPFDRYRKYRSLAQVEELKEFKEKEAKIAAIGKGNELIKTEVLVQIQQAKTQVENEDRTKEVNDKDIRVENKKAEKRKRKMSPVNIELDDSKSEENHNKPKHIHNSKSTTSKNVNPYPYKNVDYKKFFDETGKAHKQPKMKMKKRK